MDNLILCSEENFSYWFYFQFISDDLFNRAIRRTVIDQSKYAPVYFYKFSYAGRLGGVSNRTIKGEYNFENNSHKNQYYQL